MTADADTRRMSLHETFEAMHRLLRWEITPAEASARLGCEESRIALYPEFVLDHVRNILVKNFSALASLFSAEEWEGIVREYFRTNPPDHYEMNANAARFPGFLHQVAEQGRFLIGEFHLELAEVEWLEWVTYSSPKRIPLPAQIEQPILNPTITVLELNFPVAEYLRTWEEELAKGFPEGVPQAPEKEQGGIVFVFRDPRTHEAVVWTATDPQLFAFKVVQDAIPLAQAAEEARIGLPEAEAILASAEKIGFVILPP
jgi:hypothetical protein